MLFNILCKVLQKESSLIGPLPTIMQTCCVWVQWKHAVNYRCCHRINSRVTKSGDVLNTEYFQVLKLNDLETRKVMPYLAVQTINLSPYFLFFSPITSSVQQQNLWQQPDCFPQTNKDSTHQTVVSL